MKKKSEGGDWVILDGRFKKMALRLENLGALGYGGVVTLSNWWDQKRIDEGKILKKDVFKKLETYTYLVPGVGAIAASAMGWLPRQAAWIDNVAIGFIYDSPRFVKGLIDAFRTETATSTKTRVVRQARQIIQEHEAATRHQLNAGRVTERSYVPSFEKVGAY